jgi:branched-chain amino acid transport system substrate-binding protein
MQRKVVFATLLALVLVVGAFGALVLTACGSSTGSTGARSESASPVAAATGEPLKIGFDEGFTGFMAVDAQLTDHGIKTALAEVNNQWMGRPIEYFKADNGSDPVVAVDKARQLVENNKIQVMLGPIFSPSNAAVTDYLAKGGGGIPSISIFGQPSDNLKTGNELSFIPAGMFSMEGYLLGKYCSETLGYKTANAINLEDTTGHELQKGFTQGFSEGGGKVLTTQYVPIDTVDFSSYLTTLKPADCTYNWIFGNGTGPFIKQYHDYGLTAPLVMTMADDLQEPVMQELGDLAVGIVGSDHYLSTVDNPSNKKFVDLYQKLYPGELPNMDSYGGYTAVMMFLNAVKATKGDTSPDALKKAMSTMTWDTPIGPVTMSAYDSVFIGTADFYIGKTELVDGNYRWMPIHTYPQVLFKNPW